MRMSCIWVSRVDEMKGMWSNLSPALPCSDLLGGANQFHFIPISRCPPRPTLSGLQEGILATEKWKLIITWGTVRFEGQGGFAEGFLPDVVKECIRVSMVIAIHYTVKNENSRTRHKKPK